MDLELVAIARRLKQLPEPLRWRIAMEASRIAVGSSSLPEAAMGNRITQAYSLFFSAYDWCDAQLEEAELYETVASSSAQSHAAMLAALGGHKNRKRVLRRWLLDGGNLRVPAEAVVQLFAQKEVREAADFVLREIRNAMHKHNSPEARREWFASLKKPSHSLYRHLRETMGQSGRTPGKGWDDLLLWYRESPSRLWGTLEKTWPEHPPLADSDPRFTRRLQEMLEELPSKASKPEEEPFGAGMVPDWLSEVATYHDFATKVGRLRDGRARRAPKEKMATGAKMSLRGKGIHERALDAEIDAQPSEIEMEIKRIKNRNRLSEAEF